MWIRYGTKTLRTGIYDPDFYQCPNCKSINSVSFCVQSTYYHIWYIPIFPIEKDGFARCSNCELKIDSIKYNRQTRDDFKNVIQKKIRHPFYLYTITILLGIFFFAIIIALIL